MTIIFNKSLLSNHEFNDFKKDEDNFILKQLFILKKYEIEIFKIYDKKLL